MKKNLNYFTYIWKKGKNPFGEGKKSVNVTVTPEEV